MMTRDEVLAERAAQAALTPAHWASYTSTVSKPWRPYRWHRLLNDKLLDLALAHWELRTYGWTNRTRILIVSVPVRHGKTELGTIAFIAWWLGMFPYSSVILGAYNATYAESMSRRIRNNLAEHGKNVFGIELASDSTAVKKWSLAKPNAGQFTAVGAGTAPTGVGGNLIVFDDPTKSITEAMSEIWQERVMSWYSFDMRPRLQDDGVIVLIQSRWGEKDLSGQLQAAAATAAAEDGDIFEHLWLPALAEPTDAMPDPLGRAAGEPLCPEMWSKKQLEMLRDSPPPLGVGEIVFDALYQNRPFPKEGNIFRSADWRYCNADEVPAEMTTIRSWDLAATEKSALKTDPDWTAGVLMGRASDGRVYILDARRTREESADVQRFVRGTAIEDWERWNNRRVFIPQDPGQAGKAQVGDYTKNVLPEFGVESEQVSGDKVTRATPFASQQRSNNIVLVRGPWNKAFVDECTGFPKGSHDDQVDAGSSGYERLVGLTSTLVRVW